MFKISEWELFVLGQVGLSTNYPIYVRLFRGKLVFTFNKSFQQLANGKENFNIARIYCFGSWK